MSGVGCSITDLPRVCLMCSRNKHFLLACNFVDVVWWRSVVGNVVCVRYVVLHVCVSVVLQSIVGLGSLEYHNYMYVFIYVTYCDVTGTTVAYS